MKITVKKLLLILLRAIWVILIFLAIFFYALYDSFHSSFAESSRLFFTKDRQYMDLVKKITNSELLSYVIKNRISISLLWPKRNSNNKSTYFVDWKECEEPVCETLLLEVSSNLEYLSLEYSLDWLTLMNDKIIVHDHGETFFWFSENYTFNYYFTWINEYHIIPNMPSDYKYGIRKRIDWNRYYVDELRR